MKRLLVALAILALPVTGARAASSQFTLSNMAWTLIGSGTISVIPSGQTNNVYSILWQTALTLPSPAMTLGQPISLGGLPTTISASGNIYARVFTNDGGVGAAVLNVSESIYNRPGPLVSAGAAQYGVSIAAATALTVPAGAVQAEICVETAAARYTDDGTTPTATVGIPLPSGTCFQYTGPLTAFKIIGAGATMDVSYYK